MFPKFTELLTVLAPHEVQGMASMKRHSLAEKKLAWNQVREMTARGTSQSDICRTLGISVMTFHRWRKELGDPSQHAQQSALSEEASGQIAVLREENDRLRRIVSDLMLEKVKIEEAIKHRGIAS